jgi:hypothetical protein
MPRYEQGMHIPQDIFYTTRKYRFCQPVLSLSFYALFPARSCSFLSVLVSAVRQKAGSHSGDGNMIIEENGGTFIEAEIHIEIRLPVPGLGV